MANIPDSSPEQLETARQPEISSETFTLLEASELVKQIEETFGVSVAASAGVVVVSPYAAAAKAVGEQNEFFVILESFDPAAKIRLLKAVREATGLGLAEAKALVEAAPKAVKEGVSRADAEIVKEQLAQAGANVYISRKHEDRSTKRIYRQIDDSTVNLIDNIFADIARIDHRISQSQAAIDDLKAETRELLSALRVSIL